MPFTNYDFISANPYYEGEVATSYPTATRAYNNFTNTTIPFGRAVVKSTASGATDSDAMLPTAANQVFLGITKVQALYEVALDASGNNGYPATRAMSVLTKGDIAVFTEQTVTVADNVFYRCIQNGSNNKLGTFRKDADTVTGGGIASVSVGTPGSGYTSAPTVGFSGGGGSGAAAVATIATDRVAQIAITNGGSSYASAPTLSIGGGGGSGATATCTVSGGAINAVTITNAGSGYSSAPTVTITGGGGSGGVLTVSLGGPVLSVAVVAPGTGYGSAPTVSFSGGGGSSAAATASVSSNVDTAKQITSARWIRGASAGGIAILNIDL